MLDQAEGAAPTRRFAPRVAVLALAAILAAGAGATSVAAGPRYDSLEAAISARVLDPDVAARLRERGSADAVVALDDRDALARAEAAGAAGTAPGLVVAALRASVAELRRPAVDALESGGGEVLRQYDHVPMLLVRFRSADALLAVANRPEVRTIHSELAVSPSVVESGRLVRQPEAAAAGQVGAGTTVAVLDSGLDYTRPAFGACTAPGSAGCRVAASLDVAPNDGALDTGSFHGTNVAGIVAGIAAGARIVALDVIGSTGTAVSSDLAAAIDWAIRNRSTYNIRAVNLSLGSGSYTPATCPFDPGFGSALAVGIVPVAAAGNSASTSGIGWPACVSAGLGIGAVYDGNLGSRSYAVCSDPATAADRITCFSQSGTALDMLAPGANITAAGLTMAGTSQASPHVAAAAAILAGAQPGASATLIRERLVSTGPIITDSRNSISVRRLDIFAAVTDLLGQSAPASPQPAPTPAPITPTPTPTPIIDRTAPTVASRSPTAGQTGVGTGSVVRARFSEPVVGVSGTTFQLRSSATGMLVSARVAYDAAGNEGVLTPSSPLATGTTYEVTLTSGITDRAGNRLEPTGWRFDTVVPVSRLAGPDRYATGAALSRSAFGSNVPAVYIATGANFPDALAAGPAAASRGGPVLLVARSVIPGPTAAELDRLRPSRIVLLGGEGAISTSVEAELRSYATTGNVRRISGPDRYATAAALSAATYAAGQDQVLIATGANFPDALAGAVLGRPLLLVTGAGLPGPTAAELSRLRPRQIVLLGGTGVISSQVEAQLRGFAGSGGVVRLGGRDRYATAALVAAAYHPAGSRPVTYVATGLNFPDALSAGPVAARVGAPLVLVRSTALPDPTRDAILRLRSSDLRVLGGTGVVAETVVVALRDLVN